MRLAGGLVLLRLGCKVFRVRRLALLNRLSGLVTFGLGARLLVAVVGDVWGS